MVKQLSIILFDGEHWLFQQDFEQAHKAKATQQWLKSNILGFTAADNWPAGSPDLKPLHYSSYFKLENMACRIPHRNLESSKHSSVRAASSMPIETVHTAIDQW